MDIEWQRSRIVDKKRNLFVESVDGKSKIWINNDQSIYIALHKFQNDETEKPVNVFLEDDLSKGWWIYREDVKDKKLKDEEIVDRNFIKKGEAEFTEIIEKINLKKFRLEELEVAQDSELTQHDKRFELYQTFRKTLQNL